MIKLSEFRAGIWQKQFQYKSFEPTLINTAWQIDVPEIILLLSQADKKLGELNAYSQLIPDVDFFIQMHVVKESTLSSRIEGTQTNIEQAIQKAEQIHPEQRQDWQEVQNYIKAMNHCIAELEKLPLSNRLIKQAHRILMQGVRGEYKQLGEFRRSQNWIGGASLNDAIFVPPAPQNLDELMSDFEKFLHNSETHLPPLLKIAIAHYQFETIHPFLDGNGRIGRLLITLFLVSEKQLTKPTLYLSDFFEKHRSLYYDNLQRVRTHNDLVQWLKFFLQGVLTTSENAIQTFQSIIKLKEKAETLLAQLGKKHSRAKKLLQLLYTKPIVEVSEVAEYLQVEFSTASRLIKDFVRLNLLQETTNYKRNRQFIFQDYLRLFL
ncbi:MAG: Fic family protein [Raineya sp.]|nr:Fic family protein [Raineya sp.]MDW8295572.1 Fic family protein [Raineya sp.]